jgi:glycine C-acetyltransferase
MSNPLDFIQEELQELKERGLFRHLRVLEGEQSHKAMFDGQSVVNLSSNNYLGLTTHPKLRQAAKEAIDKLGVGSGSVRTIAGTMSLHQELEEKLARFKHTEASLVFQSGFTANMGVITALVGDGDVIISDELNHASIIDGCRLTRAERRVYPHKDMVGLEKVLEANKHARRTLIITDGVFSMDGDIAPLPEIVELAERYNAMVMVDDAHSSGVLGSNGRGSVDHFKLHGRVHIQVGTLSKALGALGGYIAGTQNLRDLLIHRGRTFLFSTSHPPSVTATCIAAIELLEQEPQLVERLWENANFFKQGLKDLGFNTGDSETPITPVIVGSGAKAMEFSDRLFKAGVFAQGIGFPTVSEEKSRVRTIVNATHTREELQFSLDVFKQVGKDIGII